MKLELYFKDQSLGDAWEKHFKKYDNVDIIDSDICATKCKAIVSPANSFGFMDGGLDLHLSETFGWHLQDKLQEKIKQLPEGELLIGNAIVLDTYNERIPYLISAPTMRVPMSFNIATSVNAYLAMKAILITALDHPKINSVAIPGLCTGCGRMSPEISALQMAKAYEEIILGKKQDHKDFGAAQKQQFALNETGLIWDY